MSYDIQAYFQALQKKCDEILATSLVGPNGICMASSRGGSGWLDSFYQFISGAWRIADYAAVRRVVRLS